MTIANCPRLTSLWRIWWGRLFQTVGAQQSGTATAKCFSVFVGGTKFTARDEQSVQQQQSQMEYTRQWSMPDTHHEHIWTPSLQSCLYSNGECHEQLVWYVLIPKLTDTMQSLLRSTGGSMQYRLQLPDDTIADTNEACVAIIDSTLCIKATDESQLPKLFFVMKITLRIKILDYWSPLKISSWCHYTTYIDTGVLIAVKLFSSLF